ncbi:MAG: hypothetical protein LC115_06580 [Bacteroidia bacterium]|nr:hypothetical protein [Bacteroidia bacterium]
MNQVFEKSLFDAEQCFNKSLETLVDYKEKHICNQLLPFDFERTENISFHKLIFSTSNGVFLLDTEKKLFKQILKGKFYGITQLNDFQWFLTRSNNIGERNHAFNERITDITLLTLDEKKEALKDIKVVLFGIPSEVHQIDIYENILYMPHTGYNQVLTISVQDLLKGVPKQLKDCQSTELKIQSSSHLNSIFIDDEKWYLIAHNFTMQTNKMSDALMYNAKTKYLDIIN